MKVSWNTLLTTLDVAIDKLLEATKLAPSNEVRRLIESSGTDTGVVALASAVRAIPANIATKNQKVHRAVAKAVACGRAVPSSRARGPDCGGQAFACCLRSEVL